MNRGLWIARKNYLFTLVKKLSDLFGGDDEDFLASHCKELAELHESENIEEAISCYELALKENRHKAYCY